MVGSRVAFCSLAILIETGGIRIRSEVLELIETIRPDAMRASLLAALEDRRRALRRYAPLMRTVLAAATCDDEATRLLRSTVVLPLVTRLSEFARVVDTHFGLDRSDEARSWALRAFMSLFVGTVVTSLALGDSPDNEVVDAMLRVMGWEEA